MRTYHTYILRLLVEPAAADEEADLRGSLQPIAGHEIVPFKSGTDLLALLQGLHHGVDQPGLPPRDAHFFDAKDKTE